MDWAAQFSDWVRPAHGAIVNACVCSLCMRLSIGRRSCTGCLRGVMTQLHHSVSVKNANDLYERFDITSRIFFSVRVHAVIIVRTGFWSYARCVPLPQRHHHQHIHTKVFSLVRTEGARGCMPFRPRSVCTSSSLGCALRVWTQQHANM